jgi:PAS domain S-box-containing protein
MRPYEPARSDDSERHHDERPDREGTPTSRPASRPGPGDEHPDAEERRDATTRASRRAGRKGVNRAPAPPVGLREVGERAFAALAENVRDYAIFLMDDEGTIVFWGEGARLIKWWTRDQAEGSHLRLLYPDGGSEDGTAEAHLEAASESGEYTGEGHRLRSDGSTFWAGVTLTALRDGSGALLGFAKVTRDLTASRAAEAARSAALSAAEEANRLKSLFLATMSHEIRTPLNAVMAYADLLDMEISGPLTEGQREQLRKIRSSSQHLLGVVDDVLDLSRLEAGRVAVGRDRLRLGTVVHQALSLVEPQAEARNVEIADAVSGFSASSWCWGDEERVRQILLNLLSNAVKFTERGGRITVSAGSISTPPADAGLEGGGPWVYVRVEDTGQGVPTDRVEAIFEPFVQADMSLTRQHGGTGLGLTISRELARLMGGDLTVRSQVGVGSTFFLWLPAAPAPFDAPPKPEAGAEPRPTAPPGALREIRDAVLAELERVLHAFVARLRNDPQMPHAGLLSEADLEDHLASFLSDVAQTLGALDPAAGASSDALQDGTAIQRTIAERHGAQRARLGWYPDEVRREYQVLREELAAAVRRRVQFPREAEVEESIAVLDEALSRAERISLASHEAELRS